MSASDYSKLNLYPHNIKSYEKIKLAYASGAKIVGIVHATGTGKTYNALQLAYDNKNKKTLYVVPSNSIKEHIIKTIKDNPNLDYETDFKNLQFITYHSLARMNDKELSELDYDYLVIDEFHHIGAPVWGPKINKLIKLHPNKFVLGMTAYTVRDRGTEFERDMANPETDELFSNKIVSTYDIVDAMIDGILPKPIYRSAYLNLITFVNNVEEKLENYKTSKSIYNSCKKILADIKRRIHESPSIEEIFRQNLKPDGKYIYFCPPGGIQGINDIDTIMAQTKEYLEKCFPNIEIVFYKTTSKDKDLGKINRDAFYKDINLDGTSTKGKLRIIFAINQYNEGVHAPNIDGVIMGRGTKSDIVFFEQLGRALAVRENVKKLRQELNKYYKEELITMAAKRKIEVNINMRKEEIIEKLLSPVVIDLSNNFEYIKELENRLKGRIKEIQESSQHKNEKREFIITDAVFDVNVINQDLFEMLKKLRNRLAPMTWDEWYALAKTYYEKYGNIKMKYNFKTLNGIDYDENGLNLPTWINNQKTAYKTGKLSEERMKKLDAIGATPKTLYKKKLNWNEMYQLALNYYQFYGNIHVPNNFKTLNGVDYDENGYNLHNWLKNQKGIEIRHNILVRWIKTRNFYDESEKRDLIQDYEKTKEKLEKLIAIDYVSFIVFEQFEKERIKAKKKKK